MKSLSATNNSDPSFPSTSSTDMSPLTTPSDNITSAYSGSIANDHTCSYNVSYSYFFSTCNKRQPTIECTLPEK